MMMIYIYIYIYIYLYIYIYINYRGCSYVNSSSVVFLFNLEKDISARSYANISPAWQGLFWRAWENFVRNQYLKWVIHT